MHYLAFCSGGTNYTVTGQNLDIVQEPRLIVYVSAPQNVAKRQAQGSQEVELLSDVSPILSKISFAVGFKIIYCDIYCQR